MPFPTLGYITPVTLVDQNGNPVAITISPNPGTVITTPANTLVGVGATVALPVPPPDTRRMTVQIVGGNAASLAAVREVGGGAGRGIQLGQFGSRVYGGEGGAVAPLEVEHLAGAAFFVAVQFERN